MIDKELNPEQITEDEKLADEHWAWLQSLLEKIYKDAFLHGYKHGYEDRQSGR